MTKGLPGSGKSTWSKNVCTHLKGYLRVNKDEIRLDLQEDWSSELEKRVITIRNSAIVSALKSGMSVISDDCNLALKHEKVLRAIAQQCGAEFEVNDSFLKVPIEECIKRDALREGKSRVGEKVIRDMYDQFLKPREPKIEPYIDDPTLPEAIICDLDGTVCLMAGKRGPFDYTKCNGDLPNKPVIEVVRAMSSCGYSIIYMSGREDSCMEMTRQWLRDNNCPSPTGLFMRKSGDYRKDALVKGELLEQHVRGRFNVLFCLDDRQQVVDFYRSLGLTVFQVAPGKF
jgi:predicted kinase